MKKALLILAGAALLAGCSCKTGPQTLCSSYRGVLPAADAAGIVTTPVIWREPIISAKPTAYLTNTATTI